MLCDCENKEKQEQKRNSKSNLSGVAFYLIPEFVTLMMLERLVKSMFLLFVSRLICRTFNCCASYMFNNSE